jgi:hypothetical protein
MLSTLVNAQPTNLIKNPFADDVSNHWFFSDNTVIEEIDGNPCFVMRYGFVQSVEIPEDAIGKYVLLTGVVSSERINVDGSITGLPYLYGYMMDGYNNEAFNGSSIHSYLAVPSSLHYKSAKAENKWVAIWNIYLVQKNTKYILFSLQQAERRGDPQNGSAARFDDLGLYLFSSGYEARAFVDELYFK